MPLGRGLPSLINAHLRHLSGRWLLRHGTILRRDAKPYESQGGSTVGYAEQSGDGVVDGRLYVVVVIILLGIFIG